VSCFLRRGELEGRGGEGHGEHKHDVLERVLQVRVRHILQGTVQGTRTTKYTVQSTKYCVSWYLVPGTWYLEQQQGAWRHW